MDLTAANLGKLEPLSNLSLPRRDEIVTMCRIEHYPIGVDPLRGIELTGQSVYLLHGELLVRLPDGGARVIVGGCDDALRPLGHQTGRPVSTRAITEVDMLRMDDDLLDILMTWDQLSSAGLHAESRDESTIWRTMTGMFHSRALTSGALARLPMAHLHELMHRFERIKVLHDTVVVGEGEEGDYYYVIESGRCEVTRAVAGANLHVAELMAGDAFGEEALVAGERRNATLRMKTDGCLWRLAKPHFIELLQTPLLHGVSASEARGKVTSGKAMWLDVRYPAEYAQDGLSGAINVPLNEVRSAFGVLDRARQYVVYCQSGRRSSAAAFLLAQHGLQAYWLEGGLASLNKTDSQQNGARHD